MITKESNFIRTLHPTRRQGVLINKVHYELLTAHILVTIAQHENIELRELLESTPLVIAGAIEKDIAWYVFQVKLDLEARGLIRMEIDHKKRAPSIKLTRQGLKVVRLKNFLQAL